MDRSPIVVSPYDAELFGHWWFEGPDWLEGLARKIHFDQKTFELITPSEYFQHYPTNQVLNVSMSTWGNGGYNEVWLNGSNDWIYRHLHKMVERMTQATRDYPTPDPMRARLLTQMAREVLLAQASDWAFIMKTQTHTGSAYRRLHDPLERFTRFDDALRQGQISESWLSEVEAKDNLFPFVDHRIYAASGGPR